MKYIVPPEIKLQVDEILAPLLNPKAWGEFNLEFAKSPAAIIRIEGEPGMGKSALANYIAHKVSTQKPITLNFDEVADQHLGRTEAKIKTVFERANGITWKTRKEKGGKQTYQIKEEGPPHNVIIMEECDALMWSRDKINEDTMHMLGFINTMLTEIDKFIKRPIPSVLILTTNYPALLDAAFESRITDVIKLSFPSVEFARALWKSKLPSNLQKEKIPAHFLEASKLSPRMMERIIVKACRKALTENRQPTIQDIFAQ